MALANERQRYRNPVADDVNEEDLDVLLFDAQDHWAPGMAPASWQTPEAHAEGGQIFAVLDICVNNLPAKPARVFSMKEFLECAGLPTPLLRRRFWFIEQNRRLSNGVGNPGAGLTEFDQLGHGLGVKIFPGENIKDKLKYFTMKANKNTQFPIGCDL